MGPAKNIVSSHFFEEKERITNVFKYESAKHVAIRYQRGKIPFDPNIMIYLITGGFLPMCVYNDTGKNTTSASETLF